MDIPLINSGANMKADLLLRGEYINVYTSEIFTGKIAVKDSRILCNDEEMEAREVVDVNGIIVPGLKDAHINIESSKLTLKGLVDVEGKEPIPPVLEVT